MLHKAHFESQTWTLLHLVLKFKYLPFRLNFTDDTCFCAYPNGTKRSGKIGKNGIKCGKNDDFPVYGYCDYNQMCVGPTDAANADDTIDTVTQISKLCSDGTLWTMS